MNQRHRNEQYGHPGDRERDAAWDREERHGRETSGRDWDQRDQGTRGGEYARFGSYGDQGFGQGAGGREFREVHTTGDGRPYGEPRAWSGDYARTNDLPEGAVNPRNFGGGQGHGSVAGYGGGYGGAEGWRQASPGGQLPSRTSYGSGPGSYGRNDGPGGYGRADFGAHPGWTDRSRSSGAYADDAPAAGGYGMSGQANYDADRAPSARSFRGMGPKGWRRSDERLQEDICERLTDDHYIDASDVSVQVSGGVVTLEGSVPERRLKHRIEDLVEQCGGVSEIRNLLSVKSTDRNASGGDDASRVGQRDAGGKRH